MNRRGLEDRHRSSNRVSRREVESLEDAFHTVRRTFGRTINGRSRQKVISSVVNTVPGVCTVVPSDNLEIVSASLNATLGN